jgi:hypothetical protein
MKKILLFTLSAAIASAQTVIPDGTRLRVRLDQTLSSSTADEGQTVELSVTEAVKLGDQVVIPEGSRVTGTITEARQKGHMGKAGKLDFSVDRVRAIDDEWIPLRYTINKKSGDGHGVRTGVITAGVAVVFWPAAPFFLLMKGKDTTINKGVIFDAFTDQNHVMASAAPAAPTSITSNTNSAPVLTASLAAPKPAGGTATVTITSNAAADIEVDGGYVGSTPSTLQLTAGAHHVSVRSGTAMWERNLQVNPGSSITVNAELQDTRLASQRRK